MNILRKNKFYDFVGVWFTRNHSKNLVGLHYEKCNYWQGIPDYRLLDIEAYMLDTDEYIEE